MKFTLNWLRQYLDSDLDGAEVAARLTMLGLEVDQVAPLYPPLEGVVVARVETVQPHPNADRLSLCEVADGSQTRRVVCGAPNVRAGMLVALALPGTMMPGGFKIKPAKIRGEASEGMLCSAKELGLGEDQEGIMDLAGELTVGHPLAEALALRDTLIEVDLTPNRPDCAGVIGLARELAGSTGRPLRKPVTAAPPLTGGELPFAVAVRSPACRRYTARLVQKVKIGPSPWWLRQRLLAVGMRPINNVVDITNFVMLEYGQPMHAFDFARLAEGRIVVRPAAAGETITTLDGVARELDPEMLLICDGAKPVAVAGIMGGETAEVSEATTAVLLESACFEATSIRRTAGRLKLATESSYRFERGVDPQAAPLALERAVQLLVELAGGEPVAGGIDCGGDPAPALPITLRLARVNALLGLELDLDSVARLLAGIEIFSEKMNEATLRVQPPSFRVDLEREIDLIEEVARLHGYDAIPTTLPRVVMDLPAADPDTERGRQAAAALQALGFYQAINYSFSAPEHGDRLNLAADDPRRQQVRLLNPLSEEQSVLRSSLLPGLLENLRHNLNHQQPDVWLYEVGKVFFPGPANELPREEERLSAAISGRRHPGAPLLWEGEALVDLAELRGAVEELVAALALPCPEFVPEPVGAAYAAPGLILRLNLAGTTVGELGKISPQTLKAFGIKQEVFYLDLNLTALLAVPVAPRAFVPLPRFPSVKWDLAMLVPEATGAGEMLAAVYEAGGKLVDKAEIFDVYRGKNIEAGLKSVAFAIHYRDPDRTLDEATVGVVHRKIIDLMGSRFQGQLREA